MTEVPRIADIPASPIISLVATGDGRAYIDNRSITVPSGGDTRVAAANAAVAHAQQLGHPVRAILLDAAGERWSLIITPEGGVFAARRSYPSTPGAPVNDTNSPLPANGHHLPSAGAVPTQQPTTSDNGAPPAPSAEQPWAPRPAGPPPSRAELAATTSIDLAATRLVPVRRVVPSLPTTNPGYINGQQAPTALPSGTTPAPLPGHQRAIASSSGPSQPPASATPTTQQPAPPEDVDPAKVPAWPQLDIVLTADGRATVEGVDVIIPPGTDVRSAAVAAAAIHIRDRGLNRAVRAVATDPDGTRYPLIIHPNGTATTAGDPIKPERRKRRLKRQSTPEA